LPFLLLRANFIFAKEWFRSPISLPSPFPLAFSGSFQTLFFNFQALFFIEILLFNMRINPFIFIA